MLLMRLQQVLALPANTESFARKVVRFAEDRGISLDRLLNRARMSPERFKLLNQTGLAPKHDEVERIAIILQMPTELLLNEFSDQQLDNANRFWEYLKTIGQLDPFNKHVRRILENSYRNDRPMGDAEFRDLLRNEDFSSTDLTPIGEDLDRFRDVGFS